MGAASPTLSATSAASWATWPGTAPTGSSSSNSSSSAGGVANTATCPEIAPGVHRPGTTSSSSSRDRNMAAAAAGGTGSSGRGSSSSNLRRPSRLAMIGGVAEPTAGRAGGDDEYAEMGDSGMTCSCGMTSNSSL